MSEELNELSKKIDGLCKLFDDHKCDIDHRFRDIEERFVSGQSDPTSFVQSDGLGFAPPGPTKRTPGANLDADLSDVQSDFQHVKSHYAKQKLPRNYTVPECRSSKRDIQHLASIVNKSARYAETALKILWSTDRHDEQSLSALSTVLMAQVHFLQEEQASVFVQSNFSNDTSRLFRSLQGTKASISETTVENIKTAATLASVKTQSDSQGPPPRARYTRPTYSRNFGRGNVYDNYQSGRGFNPQQFRSNPRRQASEDRKDTALDV